MSEGPIGKDYFIGYFKESEKEKSRWKIGLEHEVVGFDQKSKKRLDYEGGLKKVLEYFALEHQWEPVFEKDNLISLNKNNSTITMEPGGQLELSCVALSEIRQIEELMNLYQNQLQEFSRREKVAWYSVGFDPVTPVDEIPWMPKQRYRIMRNYLPQFGLGVNHMMKSSCTVQSNFDYSSEDDMIQ
ncbi:MAG: glutamate-cysteine ligase family protein, partial [Deltaproteobacteria bacterium]|nr:glutamate-cysteine ligase family protein [Deltaproteobacteria bacterium]